MKISCFSNNINISFKSRCPKQYMDSLMRRADNCQLESGHLSKLYERKILDNEDVTTICTNSAGKIPKQDILFFAKAKVPLTNADTKQITQTRFEDANERFLTTADSEFLANNKKILASEMKKLSKIPSEKKMVLVYGLSGSGKSTYIENSPELSKKYYLADIDMIKNYFPEYRKNKKTNRYHDIARTILQKELLPQAIEQGKNIVLPTTGDIEYIMRLAKPAKSRGYNVELQYLKVNINEALSRTIKRFETSGRYLDTYFITSRAPIIKNHHKVLKENPFIDSIKIIDCEKVDFRTDNPQKIAQHTKVYK